MQAKWMIELCEYSSCPIILKPFLGSTVLYKYKDHLGPKLTFLRHFLASQSDHSRQYASEKCIKQGWRARRTHLPANFRKNLKERKFTSWLNYYLALENLLEIFFNFEANFNVLFWKQEYLNKKIQRHFILKLVKNIFLMIAFSDKQNADTLKNLVNFNAECLNIFKIVFLIFELLPLSSELKSKRKMCKKCLIFVKIVVVVVLTVAS
ncbi:hypothetical protein BpHYR1_026224 [Brachionus plicatilis]|uniref:Uncharacterized protein n=1 Tax=Brachionus plicatilis TaxID=10195 RepID=A0A3M7T3P4_BRAPC|nr:hypothetical protein BpHYR1_026224 [Brachionus plicatilis]